MSQFGGGNFGDSPCPHFLDAFVGAPKKTPNWRCDLHPRDPNTERQWMIGVSNHLRNAKYLLVGGFNPFEEY